MRKISMVFVFTVLFGVAISAQAKTVDELNGYDWNGWDYDHKTAFVQGFYSAHVMFINQCFETTIQPYLKNGSLDQETAKARLEQIIDQFGFTESIGQMVEKVDDFYASVKTRSYDLYRVIVYVAGKEWWNRKTGEVEIPGVSDQVQPDAGS